MEGYSSLAQLHQDLFQIPSARECLARASAAKANFISWDYYPVAVQWCIQHALSGDWPAAYTAACEIQALRAAWGNPLPWFDFARQYETEALLRAGDRANAEAAAQHLAAHLGTNQRYRLVWLRMQAVLDRHAGDHAAALVHLIAAASLATVLDLPSEAWQIANEQATTYSDLGDASHAQAARAVAEAGIARLATGIADTALREHFTQAALRHPPALH